MVNIPDYAMSLAAITPPKHKSNPAGWTYDKIAEYILDFQKDLDDDHEVGAFLANYPGGKIHIKNMGYSSPHIISFEGFSEDGNPVQLLQHFSQLNLVLVKVPKLHEKPIRIGFKIPTQPEEEQ